MHLGSHAKVPKADFLFPSPQRCIKGLAGRSGTIEVSARPSAPGHAPDSETTDTRFPASVIKAGAVGRKCHQGTRHPKAHRTDHTAFSAQETQGGLPSPVRQLRNSGIQACQPDGNGTCVPVALATLTGQQRADEVRRIRRQIAEFFSSAEDGLGIRFHGKDVALMDTHPAHNCVLTQRDERKAYWHQRYLGYLSYFERWDKPKAWVRYFARHPVAEPLSRWSVAGLNCQHPLNWLSQTARMLRYQHWILCGS